MLLLVAAVPAARRLTFDQTIESFFAPQHPDIQLLKRTREVFGGDEFVIVAWRQPELLTDEAGTDPVEVTAETYALGFQQRFVEGGEVQPIAAVLLAGDVAAAAYEIGFGDIAEFLDLGEQISAGEHGLCWRVCSLYP